jgi:branched-chain amino acid transport system permease protein
MNVSTLFARRSTLVAAVALVLLAVVPFQLGPYDNGRITIIFVFAIAILGLNLIAGYTGQLSVAQSFFLGIGGYGSALLLDRVGVPSLLCIPLSGLLCLIVGGLIAIPVLRLRGFYLMVVTLALTFLLSPLLKRFPDLTGGAEGLSVSTPTPLGGLYDDQWIYLVSLVVAAILFWAARNLVKSQYGPAMIAIREREIVAEAVGVDASRIKTQAFAIASMYAGIAGSLYVFAIGYASPDSFGMHLGLLLFAGAFIGGIATIPGAIIGAAFVQLVPQYASNINDSFTSVIFGAAIILAVRFFPDGLAGLGRDAIARFRRKPADADDHPAPAISPAGSAEREVTPRKEGATP